MTQSGSIVRGCDSDFMSEDDREYAAESKNNKRYDSGNCFGYYKRNRI